MPLFKVLKPGLLTTVQDLGRFGFRHMGVPVSGAVDGLAFGIANVLVGNAPDAACLEATIAGPEFEVLRDCVVAITGADMAPRLAGNHAPMWESFFCSAGDILSLGYRRSGSRSYIAVSGGIDVPVVLGSRSTLLSAAFGGYSGRPLKQGDLIHSDGKAEISFLGNRYPSQKRPVYQSSVTVRVIKGVNANRFSTEDYNKLFSQSFVLTQRSDRMGCCMDNSDPIHSNCDAVSESYPAAPGSIQVLPSGNPVVLLNDAQSTGGYPQIACVVSPDLWKLAQLVPGDRVSIREIRINDASLFNSKSFGIEETETMSDIKFYKNTGSNRYEISFKGLISQAKNKK